MSTNMSRDTRTRPTGTNRVVQNPNIGTQYSHSYTGYWRRTAPRTAQNAFGCPLLQRHMYSSMYANITVVKYLRKFLYPDPDI